MDQIFNLYEVLIAVATVVGGAIIIAWIWMKKNTSSNNSATGDGILSSNPRPSCVPPSGQDYEVFLSFRGEDTRKQFTDHLYSRLVDAGVWVFRDNEGLHVGEKIGPELIKAIKASKISIPVISPNYASSKWCLKELAEILECKKTGQIVMPIFYKVTPTDVRNQTGEFKKAFHLHQKKYGSNDIQVWKNALKEVASLKGLESDKIADGHEGELVKKVLRKVLKKLKKANLVVGENLIGVQDHVEKITEMVDAKGSKEAQAILIHGMGGIGKTTLAKLIYNQFSTRFDHCGSLQNVRERSTGDRGKVDLQKQLISDILGQTSAEGIRCTDEGINVIKERFREKKVLILLDDVDHRDQVTALVGEGNWIGPKSIVIVTSRNSDILAKWENTLKYELNELDCQQSFQLFCFHAFGRNAARQCELEAIAKEIASITGGLPLAIEVIGSLLFGKSKDSWEDILKILKETPNDEVLGKLKISYDSLNYAEQQIFLDIACFSFEAERDYAYYMWDACGFHPRQGVKNLITLSLIKIGNKGQLIMHDQLRDLGKEIVRRESFVDPGKRSRLWITEEAWDVLKEKQGTREVQALRLQFYGMFEANFGPKRIKKEGNCLTGEHFVDLRNLRFLQIDNPNLVGDFNNVFTNLRWLQSTELSIPTNFHPKKLVVLDLTYSLISEHWSGWSQIEMVQKLKVLSLCSCYNLTTTPDFSAFKALEILSLEMCESLNTIHPSICSIKETLTTLDISGCMKLEELPTEFGEMEKLKKLIVDHTSIGEIPISEGSMTKLEILSAIGCKKLSNLPDSIGSLVNLHSLSLQSCSSLTRIPESIGKLESLAKLDLSKTKIVELPESIGGLHNLKELNISSTPIKRLTPAIEKLRKLQILLAEYLCSLIVREVPDIGELSCLRHLSLQGSHVSCLPDSILKLSSLQKLELFGCQELSSLPDLPGSLMFLSFAGDSMETLPNIYDLSNLKELIYGDKFEIANRALKTGSLNKLQMLRIFGNPLVLTSINLLLELPSSLVTLSIKNCCTFRMLPDLSNLKQLSYLELDHCSELVEINGLEGLDSLEKMSIRGCGKLSKLNSVSVSLMYCSIHYCEALENLPHFARATNLKTLDIERCSSLVEIQGLDSLQYLEVLRINICPSLVRISDLSHLKMLRDLELKNLKLSNIGGIDQLRSLEKLEFYGCPCLERVGDLSHLKKLTKLKLCNCKMLHDVEGVNKLSSLQILEIVGCNPCFKFPDTSKLKNLRHSKLKAEDLSCHPMKVTL